MTRPAIWLAVAGLGAAVAACAPTSQAPAPVTAPQQQAFPIGGAFRDCPDCPEMVVLPGGAFQMGAEGGEQGRPEGPVRTVTIPRPFAVGKTEVTTAQYEAFVRETGHTPSTDCRRWVQADRRVMEVKGATFRTAYGRPAAADEPATCVSWRDAQAYVGWLAKKTGRPYRLLSEAEWEFAARAGSPAPWPWGTDANQGCAFANLYDATGRNTAIAWPGVTCDDKRREIAPVGSFRPNAFGLHDMIGNAMEWTADCLATPFPAAAPVDGTAHAPAGACERRAVRGGAWITTTPRTRVTFRSGDPETFVSWIFTFRVARDLPAPAAPAGRRR
jgi:formylglycine-generating enzyme required for sulfatase activity